jgi:hypothetical protein
MPFTHSLGPIKFVFYKKKKKKKLSFIFLFCSMLKTTKSCGGDRLGFLIHVKKFLHLFLIHTLVNIPVLNVH